MGLKIKVVIIQYKCSKTLLSSSAIVTTAVEEPVSIDADALTVDSIRLNDSGGSSILSSSNWTENVNGEVPTS